MPREPDPVPIGRLRVKAGERPAHARRYLADCGLPKERTYFEGVMCKICTLLLDRVTGKVTEKVTENQRKILSVVAQNSRATQDEIAQMVGISRVHTAKNLKNLPKWGLFCLQIEQYCVYL